MEVKIKKLCDNAVIPSYAKPGDAGMDMVATSRVFDKYGNVADIAEISLYRNDSNGYAGFPFSPMQNGADVFLWHDVSTWGEIWTPSMWKSFVYWRDHICSEDIIQRVDMPDRIKSWTRAWSKYYNAYLLYICLVVTSNIL